MKRVLAIFLGILTAIGGFVDIGDLVANAETGARFGMNLAWAVLIGVVGIIVYAEMCGRVAASPSGTSGSSMLSGSYMPAKRLGGNSGGWGA